jgi:hypothetical protein
MLAKSFALYKVLTKDQTFSNDLFQVTVDDWGTNLDLQAHRQLTRPDCTDETLRDQITETSTPYFC